MAKINPFENYAQEYDEWFDKNRFVMNQNSMQLKS